MSPLEQGIGSEKERPDSLKTICSLVLVVMALSPITLPERAGAEAEEVQNSFSASQAFQKGNGVFSVKSGWFLTPALLLGGITAEPGIHRVSIADDDFTMSKLGFDLGWFLDSRVLLDLGFHLDRYKRDSYKFTIVEIEAGLSYLLPLTQRIFLDLGAGAGMMILTDKGEYDSDTESNPKIGLHLALGIFLVRDLSLSLGFYHERHFGILYDEDVDVNMLYLRARLSYYFPLIKPDGTPQAQDTDGGDE